MHFEFQHYKYYSVPLHIRQAQTLASFKRHLKTFYLQSAFLAPLTPLSNEP